MTRRCSATPAHIPHECCGDCSLTCRWGAPGTRCSSLCAGATANRASLPASIRWMYRWIAHGLFGSRDNASSNSCLAFLPLGRMIFGVSQSLGANKRRTSGCTRKKEVKNASGWGVYRAASCLQAIAADFGVMLRPGSVLFKKNK